MVLAQRPDDENERQRVLHELRILDTPDEPAFDALVQLALRHPRCRGASIGLIDTHRVWCKAVAGNLPREFSRRGSPAALAVTQEQPYLVRDAASLPAGTGFFAGAPLVVEDVRVGVICFIGHDAPVNDTLDMLAGLAEVANALLTGRLREQRARLAEARVRTASRAASDWLWETDAAGNVTWLTDNDGSRPCPLIGENWLALYQAGAQTYPSDWARLVGAFEHHESFRQLLTAAMVSGERAIVASGGEPVFDRHGKFKGFRGASRDVTHEHTQRDAAAATLARRQQQLLELQARQSAILAALPDEWVVIDEHGHHLEASDSPLWSRLPLEQIRGQSGPAALPDPVARATQQAILDALRLNQTQRYEFELGNAHDEPEQFEARVTPMPNRRVLLLARNVTEFRRLENDRLMLERAAEAEGAMAMAVFHVEGDHLRITLVNRAFERLSGLNRMQASQRSLRDLQDGYGLLDAFGAETLRRAAVRGEGCQVQVHSRDAAGQPRELEVHMAPVHDAHGRLTHFVCLFEDVTARTRVAEQLRMSEELYRAVASSMSDGMLVFMNEGVIAAANPAACEILGVQVEELLGCFAPWPFELCDTRGNLLEGVDDPIYTALQVHGSTTQQVVTLRRRDGHVRRVSMSCRPLEVSEDGQAAPVLAAFRDITAQHEAEQSLAAAEARWKFALEGSGQGVWDWDDEQNSLFLSEAWRSMLGCDIKDPSSFYDEWMMRVFSEDREMARTRLVEHLRGDTPLAITQYRMRRKDGSICWVLSRAKVVRRDAEGRAVRVVGTLVDITAHRDADDARRDKQAAELASKSKSEFLARMSHEMRTPLNAVIGFSQLLLTNPHDTAGRDVREYAEHVQRAGEHLLDLINDVLDLQKVEEGRIVPNWDDVSMEDLADRVIELLKAPAAQRNVQFDVRVDPNVVVRADERLLRQVLLNIASNAVKYNRAGGHVRWTAELTDDLRAIIHIEDDGPGLTPMQLSRMFQPFERLGQETSGIEGSGLGLMIAQRLCRVMGGTVEVSSQPGRGTRVSVTMPLAHPASTMSMPFQDTTPEARHTDFDPLPALSSRPQRPLSLLYVEDNHVNALLFEAALKLHGGFELRVAIDGQQALDILSTWRPDVLVLDAHLPGTDGFELLRVIRQKTGSNAPAFMCSADAMPEDIQRADAAGFVGYWVKPIDIARIVSDLERVKNTQRFPELASH